jgi:hypothetical protein
MRLGVVVLVVASTALASERAQAETCPIPADADPKLAQVDARDRMHFLQRELGAQARYAGLWQTTWFATRTLILAAEVGMAFVAPDPDDRLDATVTSVFAALPPIGTILFGLRVSRDGPRFLRLDHLDTDASRCAYIARGEQFFARDADNEDESRNWVQHALQIGGSTALFLILGLGYDHWRNAILNGAAGIALGEFQILSQPTGLVSAWRRYRAGELANDPKVSFKVAPQLSPSFAGLSVVATF